MENVDDSSKNEAKWNSQRLKLFVAACLSELRKNGGALTDNSGFKTQGWNSITTHFNKLQRDTENHEHDYTSAQLQSKYANVKADYKLFSKIVDNSGFGWNEETKMPTADKGVWDDFMTKHPKCKKFMHKSLPFYDESKELFENKIATGKFSSSSVPSFSSALSPAPAPALAQLQSHSSTVTPSVVVAFAHINVTTDEANDPPGTRGSSQPPPKRVRHTNDKTEIASSIKALVQMQSDALRSQSAAQAPVQSAGKLACQEFEALLRRTDLMEPLSTGQKIQIKELFRQDGTANFFMDMLSGDEERVHWIKEQLDI